MGVPTVRRADDALHAHRWLFAAAAVILAVPVAETFWVAWMPEPQWVQVAGARVWVAGGSWFGPLVSWLVLATSVLTARGDRISRYLVPVAVALCGWRWLVVFTALRATDRSWCAALAAWIEWPLRRAWRLVREGASVPGPRWSRRRRRQALATLFAVACITNTAGLLRYTEAELRGIDGQWYLDAAESLIERGEIVVNSPIVPEGVTAPTRAARMPGYPLFLAACKLLAGPHAVRAAAVAQCLGNAVTALLIFLIAEALLGSLAGLIGGMLYAFYGPACLAAPSILTEPFVLPLYALTGYLLIAAVTVDRPAAWLAVGACLGAGLLVRPNAAPAPLLIGVVAARGARRAGAGWRALRGPAWMWLALVAALLPWWARNYRVFHEFVPLSTLGGFNAWTGNDPRSRGAWWDYYYREAGVVLNACGGDEVVADRVFQRRALKQMAANFRRPAVTVSFLRWKATRLMLTPCAGEERSFHLFLLAMALLGIAALRRSRASRVLLCFPASLVLLHLATYGHENRYFLPAMPFVCAWAGAGIAALLLLVEKQRQDVQEQEVECGAPCRP